MLLGEFIRINGGVISSQHEASGSNKQRYRPDHRHMGPIGYWSMYPLTEDTTLICMFVDESRSMGTYYIPSEEPLLRKYPKRTIEDSFVNVRNDCSASIVDRVVDINNLPVDARVAYLYLSAIRAPLNGMMSCIKRGPNIRDNIGNLIYDIEVHGQERVNRLVRDEADIVENVIPELMVKHRKIRSAILFRGVDRIGGRIGLSLRSSLGNILELLFSHMGVSPPRHSQPVREPTREAVLVAAPAPINAYQPGSLTGVDHNGRLISPDRLLHIDSSVGIEDDQGTEVATDGEELGSEPRPERIDTIEPERLRSGYEVQRTEEFTIEDDEDEY